MTSLQVTLSYLVCLLSDANKSIHLYHDVVTVCCPLNAQSHEKLKWLSKQITVLKNISRQQNPLCDCFGWVIKFVKKKKNVKQMVYDYHLRHTEQTIRAIIIVLMCTVN